MKKILYLMWIFDSLFIKKQCLHKDRQWAELCDPQNCDISQKGSPENKRCWFGIFECRRSNHFKMDNKLHYLIHVKGKKCTKKCHTILKLHNCSYQVS